MIAVCLRRIVKGAKKKRLPGVDPTGISKLLPESLAGWSGECKYFKFPDIGKMKRTPQNQLKIFEQLPESEPQNNLWAPVRDDFNFCRLALFAAADKRADRFRDIKQQFTVKADGKSFTATWEVRHDPVLGLLGSFDRDVWNGMLELALVRAVTLPNGKKRYPDRIDLGSCKGFLKRIGKPESGKYVAMLQESIRRLLKTICFSEKAFNVPDSGGYLSVLENMSLLTRAGFKGDPAGDGKVHETTWVELGEHVRLNLEGGYIALIDAQYVRQLKGELTKHLYPLLSYRFWLAAQRGRDFHQAHWEELRDYLAVSGWDTLSRAKKRLKAAFLELKAQEYIDESSDWNSDSYFFKVGKKFIDELSTRLNAKEQYKSWREGKRTVNQLRLLSVSEFRNPIKVTSEDERESALTRQAIRIGLFNQDPDLSILQKHGWTLEDARSLAESIRQKK